MRRRKDMQKLSIEVEPAIQADYTWRTAGRLNIF